jgi:hypothetical protein
VIANLKVNFVKSILKMNYFFFMSDLYLHLGEGVLDMLLAASEGLLPQPLLLRPSSEVVDRGWTLR